MQSRKSGGQPQTGKGDMSWCLLACLNNKRAAIDVEGDTDDDDDGVAAVTTAAEGLVPRGG